MNTWPNNKRCRLSQSEHEKWNSHEYPGTRQLCSICDEPTGRCEDDSLYSESDETICYECYVIENGIEL